MVRGCASLGGANLERRLTVRRGDLCIVELELDGGVARKPVLVVSSDAINQAGMHAVTIRVTSRTRPRAIPTAVEVDPDHENGLAETSYVLCHDLLTVRQAELGTPFGRLGPADLFAVERGLRYALSLGG